MSSIFDKILFTIFDNILGNFYITISVLAISLLFNEALRPPPDWICHPDVQIPCIWNFTTYQLTIPIVQLVKGKGGEQILQNIFYVLATILMMKTCTLVLNVRCYKCLSFDLSQLWQTMFDILTLIWFACFAWEGNYGDVISDIRYNCIKK